VPSPGLFPLTCLTPILTGQTRGAHRQVSGAIFGYLYIGLPMAYLVFIKAAERWGLEFLLVVGLAVALSDVAVHRRLPAQGPQAGPGGQPRQDLERRRREPARCRARGGRPPGHGPRGGGRPRHRRRPRGGGV